MCVKWMVIPKSQAFFSKSDPYAVYQVVQFNVNKKRCSSLTKIWLQKSCLQPPTFNEKKFLSTISKAKSWAHLQVGNWASQQSGTQYLIPKRHETWKRRGKIEWTYEICDIPICRYLYIYIYKCKVKYILQHHIHKHLHCSWHFSNQLSTKHYQDFGRGYRNAIMGSINVCKPNGIKLRPC